jgi:EAL domain-containing protein (putative c-di-GMP-specific phosphodiesterase class I)
VPGAVEILENLQETGVQIALDDFGTGYSSFSVLIDLPLDTLKLDRSIISGLGTNPDVSNVAGAMIGMAHGLGLSVVAEGVETETQLNILRNLDCDEVQGFYYSPPVPADEFERLVLDDLV